MQYEIIILIILLLLSGFFSSSELAFVVANKLKIELRARKNNLAAKNAHYFVENPQLFFSTILISNNIVNITFASLFAYFISSIYHLTELEILLFSTVLLLFIGELIPKYLARELADSYILAAIIPIRVITFLMYPIVKLISTISGILTRTDKMEVEEAYLLEKEDIQNLLEESSEAGKVDEEEYDIINKIMELREQKVYEVMTPRTDIVGIDINSTIQEALDVFIESGYSKLPIYDENLDNIKGIVITYDMFRNPENLKSVMRDVIFVPETKRSLDMLNEFLDKRISFAVVVDEFGGTAGIITVEDIIEEMLGEIRDEYDVDEEICQRIDKYNFVIGGKVEIDYVNEEFNLAVPEGDYETIGGYITNAIGKIPLKGETFSVDHFHVLIIRSSKTRIDLVKLTVDHAKYEEIINLD
ncbi:MAG: hemolysin [Ignavibacteria bacterium RBG_13_36_8]|nr:MAG: hemolysin [Ignavibacteria bacterium RBG_13_36_8]